VENTKIIEQLTATAEALFRSTEALRQALEMMQAESDFIPISEATERLNVRPRWIRDRIAEGWWKYGREYRDTSNGDRPNYQICVAAVRKWLEIAPERRSKPRQQR